jgi:hypothetical protein
VRSLLPAAAAEKAIEIWFQDEARVGQKGTLAHVWAPCGTRPRAVQDTRYGWAYLFGAVCPERAVGAGLVMPHANTEAMNLHLAEISRTIAPGAHAVLVADGAGWHISAKLTVPDNISLLKLPPYAPELNPIENVWAYLRGTKLAHRLFKTYDDIVNACCDAWNTFISDPEIVRSITTRKWATCQKL